jgi:hypothetical protein
MTFLKSFGISFFLTYDVTLSIWDCFVSLGNELFFASLEMDFGSYFWGEYFSNLYFKRSGSSLTSWSTFFWIFGLTLFITNGLES